MQTVVKKESARLYPKMRRDLQKGKQAEGWIAESLNEWGYDTLDLNEDGRFDIALVSSDTTIEVKHDRESNYTENFAIPYEKFGKPCGIANTEAELWCQAPSESEVYWFKTEDIQRLIVEAGGNIRRYHNTRNRDNCWIYLIPKKDLIPLSLSQAEVIEMIMEQSYE